MVPRTVSVRPALTARVAEPKPPARTCRDDDGAPTLCNSALADWLDAWRMALRKANGQLGEIEKLAPAVTP